MALQRRRVQDRAARDREHYYYYYYCYYYYYYYDHYCYYYYYYYYYYLTVTASLRAIRNRLLARTSLHRIVCGTVK